MFIKNYRQQKQRVWLIIKRGDRLRDNIINELSASLNQCVTKLSIISAIEQFNDYLQFINDANNRLTDSNNKKTTISHDDIDNCTHLIQLAVSMGAILLQRLIGDETSSALISNIVLQLTSTYSRINDLYLICMQILSTELQFDAIETCCNLFITSNDKFISKIITPLPKSQDLLANQLKNSINKSNLDAFQIMIPACITTKNYQKALNYLVYFGKILNSLNQHDADYLSLEANYNNLKKEASKIIRLLSIPQPAPFTPYCDTNDKVFAVKKKISEACIKVNCQAYLFGGAMRDHNPSDLDIVLVNNSQAQQFISSIKQTCFIFSEYEKYGRHVVQANYDGCKIDFTFFDGDIKTHSANLDFTVNALYQDLSNGNIIDPQQHGKNDLQTKILQCIANTHHSLTTNPVRILRAVKIIAKCDFSMHETMTKTLNTIFIEKNYFSLINADRLYAEFVNLFMRGFGYKSYTTLANLNLLNYLFPLLGKLTGDKLNKAKQLIEFTLKFIDNAINDHHEIIPPALLYYAIHWYDVETDLSSNLVTPWINLQYGDYPALNFNVERCCQIFIHKFLSNEIDVTCRWRTLCELQQQQGSNYLSQHTIPYSTYSKLFIWQSIHIQHSIPVTTSENEVLPTTSPADYDSLRLK